MKPGRLDGEKVSHQPLTRFRWETIRVTSVQLGNLRTILQEHEGFEDSPSTKRRHVWILTETWNRFQKLKTNALGRVLPDDKNVNEAPADALVAVVVMGATVAAGYSRGPDGQR